jgi:hypothetical protein
MEKIEGVGKCHKVKLQIQDYNLESQFYIVSLGGVDVVLGVQWLQTLGTYFVNHQKHFIKFKMARGNIQVVWIPTSPNLNCIIPSEWRS